jgi:glyoxylase-like metal-dependent hydrolase (beta-lactamase superfamily II)
MESTQRTEEVSRRDNQDLQQVDSLSPWFEISQINADTFAVLEPYHAEEVISYLVVGTERAALIDTGMGIGNIRKEVERLTDVPIVVVNTHTHFDHVGDNHRFSDVCVFDHDREVARLERGYTAVEFAHTEFAPFMGPESYRRLPPTGDPASYEIRPSPVTRRLHHLDVIELAGRRLTVHHTPGHSPGSICLVESRDCLLFTGDTFYPDGTLVVHLPESDFTAYYQSIRYLLALSNRRPEPVSQLCPAHNKAYAPKESLVRVSEAFERIARGQVEYEVQEKTRLYHFDGFRVRLPFAENAAAQL